MPTLPTIPHRTSHVTTGYAHLRRSQSVRHTNQYAMPTLPTIPDSQYVTCINRLCPLPAMPVSTSHESTGYAHTRQCQSDSTSHESTDYAHFRQSQTVSTSHESTNYAHFRQSQTISRPHESTDYAHFRQSAVPTTPRPSRPSERRRQPALHPLSLIHISEPTRLA